MSIYFPFAPGLPWKIKNKIIIPTLEPAILYKAINDRDVTIIVNGGLFESFMSLFYLETLNYSSPTTKLQWSSVRNHHTIFHMNGLATYCGHQFDNAFLKKYPVPVFLDQKNNVFFNCLNNYIDIYRYTGGKPIKNKIAIGKQILANLTIPITLQSIPRFRNATDSEFKQWCRINHIVSTQPYICLFVDTNVSIHHVQCLKWNTSQIRAFSSILKQHGYQIIICTDAPGKYYGFTTAPTRYDITHWLLRSASFVMATEIDFLLLSIYLSKAKIITEPTNHQFSFGKHAKLFQKNDDICTLKNPSPVVVADLIRGEI